MDVSLWSCTQLQCNRCTVKEKLNIIAVDKSQQHSSMDCNFSDGPDFMCYVTLNYKTVGLGPMRLIDKAKQNGVIRLFAEGWMV